MPPAKKSASRGTRSRASTSGTTRSRSTSSRGSSSRSTSARAPYKEPAALKRLSKSLESANAALADLQKQTGRDVSKTARDLYKDLRSVVTNARRHSGRLTSALQRDFEQAQKKLKTANTRSSRTTTSSRSRKKATPTARRRPATRARSTSSRTSARASGR